MRYGKFLAFSLSSLFLAPVAGAKGYALTTADTGMGGKLGEVTLDKFTSYAPLEGGMNGSCKGGALKKEGVDVCKHFLEDYIKNASLAYVAAAAPCTGSNAANAFGGVYDGQPFLAAGLRSTDTKMNVGVVDHYKCGEGGGVHGSNGLNKFDIIVRKSDSAESKKVNTLKGSMKWVGTFEQFRDSSRTPTRLAYAEPHRDSLLASADFFVEDMLSEAIFASALDELRGPRQRHEARVLASDDRLLSAILPGRKKSWGRARLA